MKTFNQIAKEVFKISDQEIRDALSPSDIPEWDSMNYLFFIAELEKKFKVSFTMDEVMNAQNIGDIRHIMSICFDVLLMNGLKSLKSF